MREFIVADTQDITKAGLQFLLADKGSLFYFPKDKTELVSLLRQHPHAVIIIDYTLFDLKSADEILILSQRFEETDWILFSEELSLPFLKRTLYNNPHFSVVLKDASEAEIIRAVEEAYRQHQYICSSVQLLLQEEEGRIEAVREVLTKTELMVLKEIALGKTTKQIALEKFVSFHTVNTHRKNIFRKLGVNNVHEAVKYALRAGIVDLMEYYI